MSTRFVPKLLLWIPYVKKHSFSPINDAVNVCDALKQNAADYKLGAIYFRILNQSPDCLSTKELSIYAVRRFKESSKMTNNYYTSFLGLYNQNDLKHVSKGHNSVLKPVLDMFVPLETDGLDVEISQGNNVNVFVSICNLTTDNLETHQMSGKVSCRFFCLTEYLYRSKCLYIRQFYLKKKREM